jgi:hypothetical protein
MFIDVGRPTGFLKLRRSAISRKRKRSAPPELDRFSSGAWSYKHLAALQPSGAPLLARPLPQALLTTCEGYVLVTPYELQVTDCSRMVYRRVPFEGKVRTIRNATSGMTMA